MIGRRVGLAIGTGAVALLPLLLGTAAPADARDDLSDVLRALNDQDDPLVRALLTDLVPREGAGVGSLHVVPLVGASNPLTTGPRPLSDQTGWAPAEKGKDLVDVIADDPPTGGAPAIVPAGTLLLGGARERVLALTEPDDHTIPRAVPAPVCDARSDPVEPRARTVGRLVPLEQRKLLLLGKHGDGWHTLLQIQAILGEAEGADTVSDVLAAPSLRERADASARAIASIPRAYAGHARGHVAFFGFRPVEVVIARTPQEYRLLAPGYLRSTAVSHAMWERALGLVDRPLPPAEAADYLGPASRALKVLARAQPKPWPRLAGMRSAWRNQRGAVSGDRTTDAFLVRLVSEGRHGPVMLEAIENGERVIHPLPLRSPGGEPVDEGPDIQGGALTEEYLRRLMERKERR
jgi:hypothetical protein